VLCSAQTDTRLVLVFVSYRYGGLLYNSRNLDFRRFNNRTKVQVYLSIYLPSGVRL
jgi:hypothetical protein